MILGGADFSRSLDMRLDLALDVVAALGRRRAAARERQGMESEDVQA